MKTKHYLIKGHVQGVAFRYHTLKTALRYQINGMVRNTPEGYVEVEAQGEPSNIICFEEFLHHGPINAQVKEVLLEYIDRPPYSGFAVSD